MNKEERNKLIEYYFHMGLSQMEIIGMLLYSHSIILSRRQLKRILRSRTLFRRKQYSSINDVREYLETELCHSGKLNGYRWMHRKCIQCGFTVTQRTVRNLLLLLDREGVNHRRRHRLRHRIYRCQGPNQVWHLDAYDKLKPFGICVSGCVDGYSRKIVWLKASSTSSDPKVIAGYFVEAVRSLKGCPFTVRGDMGTENGHVAQMQSFFFRKDRENRHFQYGRSTANQRIERWWGILRLENAQYWMDIFHTLKDDGYFSGDALDKGLIQFCFMKMIQV